ncbi:ABC transporter substrate-binding protein [Parenemella sanctibonifatiensis]|uniref:ABC transporter substrate-binding protein n=1 Tax=Parenemella sanctibonifatiensis TaxID=2016505 RepID=A0A255EKC0_9ACTN|nr:ABC transporter substrate-binding protein [Parenemella sanctibonifatiensis]OYN91421.1 ABC transporter substrate-binding protein [Parenemella sanctibonifatiensis]
MVVLTACSPNSGEDDLSRLNIGATAAPPTLDPTASDAAAIPQVLLYNVYETLVKLDSTGELIPLLAQRWQVSPDRLTYTFDLDPQATFASGAPLTAESVVWNIERMTNEDTTAVLAQQMSVVESATAVDEDTLTVTLKQPSNNWLFNMASSAGVVMEPDAAGDRAQTPAGSGPYTVSTFAPGQRVVLSKSEQYWGTPPRFDEVTFRYFADPNAMNSAMLSGQLDIISNLQAPQSIDQFEDPARFSIVRGTTNGEVVLSYNNESPALSDPRVRQAITLAIDRASLLRTVWNNEGTLIGSMVPPTDPWYEDLSERWPYDPDRARELLAEAGATDLVLRLRVPTLPYATASARTIAAQLAEVGIRVEVDELEFPARWLDVVLSQADYDMSIVSHVEPRDIVKFADPDYYFRYDNPEFQRLIAEADTADEATQIELMRQAAKLLADDAAANWLFLLPNLVIARAGITGISPNATSLSFDLTTLASARN